MCIIILRKYEILAELSLEATKVNCQTAKFSGYGVQWNPALRTLVPEMQPSMTMQTLCSVRNAISIDIHTNRPPEMRTPRYSVERTLGIAPTVSLPI